jgi:hypothetical protein
MKGWRAGERGLYFPEYKYLKKKRFTNGVYIS